MSQQSDTMEGIAVVGMSIRFPEEATTPESFWDMIMQKRCASKPFPTDRINLKGIYHPDSTRHDTVALQGAHFLSEDSTSFDAPFFSISATEAASMDPQQRLLLETTYRAVENAGIPLEALSGSNTSVFSGCFTDDYKTLYQKDVENAASYAATGITTTLNANRISWFFNTFGTSVNIDTACSSSLVALDLACQTLWSKDSNLSIASGANLILAADLFYILSDMNMLSRDSRCWSFDERGNGYARGEGIGVLVLKRVSDAIRDGDTIRAVIRSTASNHDGYTPGITQPNQKAQELLIRDCYAKAGLSLDRTGFFEAHGTGTPVGDPIEANALGNVFREGRDRANPLYVGAVKSNIGHLEGASGIAGVVKAILVLEKGIIPPNTNFRKLNERIDEDYLKLKFPIAATPWPSLGLRRASVNSFGFGGSNAHAILDDTFHYLLEHGLTGNHGTVEFPPTEATSSQVTEPTNGDSTELEAENQWLRERPKLLVFSAADEHGIKRIADAYSQHLLDLHKKGGLNTTYVNNLAYTLALRRSSLLWKAFSICNSYTTLQDIPTSISKPLRSNVPPKVAFIFTGQGAQWVGMGKELLVYKTFRQSLEDAESFLKSLGCTWELLDCLLNSTDPDRIHHPVYSQTLCTIVQVALIELLSTFGIRPSAVIGHSSGEIAAAYASGAISQHSAWKIAYMRGVCTAKLLHSSVYRGAMVSVGLSQTGMREILKAFPHDSAPLVIACHNSPRNVTVSGENSQIDALISLLNEAKIFCRKLKVDVAYHSPQMVKVYSEYITSIQGIEPGSLDSGEPIMISSVTGQRISADELKQPEYWAKNMVSPVQFVEAVEHICASKVLRKKLDGSHLNNLHIDVCVEIGPHPALSGPLRDIASSKDRSITYLASIRRHASALSTLLETAGKLYCLGYSVDIQRINDDTTNDNRTDFMSLCDLPEYPFDHSKSYLHESRISKGHRLRSQPKLDLLGKTAADWNPMEAKWSNFIKISELPWVEDHKINDMILYPAAGMLVMAIEAMKQLADDSNRSIHGFELKDVKLITALVIPATTTGVEIQFTVRQNLEVGSKEISWSNFRLYSNIDDKWTEVCSGSVRIDPGIALSEIHGQNEVEKTRQYHAQCWAESIKDCTQDVDINQLYEFCKSCGFDYGSNFQVLNDAKFSNMKAKAQVKPFEWVAQGEVNPPQPHVIHPTTLDGFLQLAMVTYTRGGTVKANTLVPSYIRKMWISNSGLASPETNSINVSSEIITQDNRGIEVEILAMKSGSQDLCARLEGVRMTFVAGSSDLDDQMPQRHNLWNLAWTPDLDLLEATDRDQLQAYCKTHVDDTEKFGNTSFYTNLTFVLFAALSRMMRETKDIGGANLPSHLKKYLSWADWQIQKYQNEVFVLKGSKITWAALCLDDEYVDAVCQLISVTNAQGKVSAAVARNLVKILRNEVDALELLFQSDLLENLYQELTDANSSFKALDKYLGAYMHQHPHSRYLEIGAGTGGSTGNILRTLSGHKNPLISPAMYTDYTYTDISESFFEKAKAKFGDHQNMIFKRLNIEQIPSEQGFTPESYDVIIAANVIHATSDLGVTLRNAYELLRPGGKLILYEITQPDILRSNFIMGLLPGWWRSSEEYRTMGPCLREDQWHKVLGENGFTGVDYEFRDYDDETCHELSILISTKSSSIPTPTVAVDSIIVTEQNSDDQMTFVTQLRSYLTSSKGWPTRVATLRETVNSEFDPASVLILTDELFQPILHNLTDGKFADLQQTLIKVNTVVWLTRTTSNGSASPLHSLVDGFARVLRVENASCKFVVIGLETSTEFTLPRIESVVRIIQRTVDAALEQYDSAFEERDGVFNVCRLQISEETGEEMYKRTLPKISGYSVWGKSPPLRLTIGSPGILDTLHFEEDVHYNDPILADEVEIEVHAVGLNFKDCLMALGQVGGQSLGLECSGIVTRVGTDSRFNPGDRVCMSTTEAFKTFARSKMQCVCRIPDGLSFAEAAALPVQFVTAWTSINLLGRLQKGESVLIHAGAGGTGQAAIQMAQYIGAEIFVTVGSNTKKQLLMTEYGLSEDHILHSRDTSFADHIKRLTGGRGVDVILNSLAGDSLVASWECLASYGRFVEIGKKDILSNSGLPMFRFHDNVTFAAFDGSRWMLDRPAEAQRGIETVIDMYSKGHLHAARPLHVYSIADTIKAFRMLADGKSSGKAVLEIKPDAAVPTILSQQPSYSFEPNKTYVIAGGLGGIGRSIAAWMASRGARWLLLLSRSGAASHEAQEFVKTLECQGVYVAAPRCDISDEEGLRKSLADCAERMPPIGGCIQATMVLDDELFENMSFAQWNSALKPKVDGSWNLHKLLPEALDFFVLLSSVSGICGQQGQANYAAANTYLDALAHYRVGRGQKAISINLGAMVSDGFLAENPEVMDRILSYGSMVPITRDDLYALLDYYCDPTMPILSSLECQTVVGMNTPQNIRAVGRDEPSWLQQPIFNALHHLPGENGTNTTFGNGGRDFRAEFSEATSLTEAGAIVSEALVAKLARSLSNIPDDVDLRTPIHSYGVDSLFAVELRSWIASQFQADVAIFEISSGASFTTLGMTVANKSSRRKAEWLL